MHTRIVEHQFSGLKLLPFRKTYVGAKPFHRVCDSTFGDASDGLDHEAYMERDDAVVRTNSPPEAIRSQDRPQRAAGHVPTEDAR
jgi:hypothetical protein